MREIVKECRKIAKKYGFKIYFKPLKDDLGGLSDFENCSIIINSKIDNRQEILSILAHEYSHLECYRKGLWDKYHNSSKLEEKMKTALKAERFVDRMAEMWLYSIDKRVRYLGAYTDSDDAEMREFLVRYYSDKID